MRYIALLRGINVGGNNKLPMPALKKAFEEAGFTGVSTYINSGNVLFFSDMEDEQLLKQRCETLIEENFALKIPVAVVAAQTLVDAMAHAPPWWNTDKQSKHNAIFVLPPATVHSVFQQVGEAKPEYEQVGFYGNVIFWSAPIKTFSKTRWSKVVGTAAYGSITIRNANTANKLAQLVQTEQPLP